MLRLWTRILSVIPAAMVLALLGELAGLIEWSTMGDSIILVSIGGIIGALVREAQNPYLYRFEKADNVLTLVLIGLFGRETKFEYPTEEIQEIEHRPRKFWQSHGDIFVHRADKARRFRLRDNELGRRLSQGLDHMSK